MSDDAPTVRFDRPEPPASGGGKEKKSRTLILVLSIIGGLLLIAIIIFLTLLFSRGLGGPASDPGALPSTSATPSDTPSSSPSETPSETPSASPSAAPSPPPHATGPRFTNFVVPKTQNCSAGGPGVGPTHPNVTVTWATAGADTAWFVNGTSDAADSQFMQIPLSGNQDDFTFPQQIGCSTDSATFTITLVGADGKHLSKSWTVTLTGDRF
ncbi:MAG: hypothetical protein ABI238_01560 [Terrimesophilobacter sp.]